MSVFASPAGGSECERLMRGLRYNPFFQESHYILEAITRWTAAHRAPQGIPTIHFGAGKEVYYEPADPRGPQNLQRAEPRHYRAYVNGQLRRGYSRKALETAAKPMPEEILAFFLARTSLEQLRELFTLEERYEVIPGETPNAYDRLYMGMDKKEDYESALREVFGGKISADQIGFKFLVYRFLAYEYLDPGLSEEFPQTIALFKRHGVFIDILVGQWSVLENASVTPLWRWAALSTSLQKLRSLLAAGANPDFQLELQGETVLATFVHYHDHQTGEGDFEASLAHLLTLKRIDLNRKTPDGEDYYETLFEKWKSQRPDRAFHYDHVLGKIKNARRRRGS